MSDGDRGGQPKALGDGLAYLAAVIVSCVLVGGLAFLAGLETERRDHAPASYSKAAKEDAQRACVGSDPAAAFECIYEKVEASQDQARGEQDLSAQQRAASAAMIGAVLSFFALIATGIGIYFVKRTLDATLMAVKDTGLATKAMQDANKIAAMGIRPWLVVEHIEAEVRYVETDGENHAKFGHMISFKVIAKVTNTGRTPAVDVISNFAMGSNEFSTLAEARKKNLPRSLDQIIAPNQVVDEPWGEMRSIAPMMNEDKTAVMPIYAALVIRYQQRDMSVIHETEYVWQTAQKVSSGSANLWTTHDLKAGILPSEIGIVLTGKMT